MDHEKKRPMSEVMFGGWRRPGTNTAPTSSKPVSE
jgi:hypothetical protein